MRLGCLVSFKQRINQSDYLRSHHFSLGRWDGSQSGICRSSRRSSYAEANAEADAKTEAEAEAEAEGEAEAEADVETEAETEEKKQNNRSSWTWFLPSLSLGLSYKDTPPMLPSTKKCF